MGSSVSAKRYQLRYWQQESFSSKPTEELLWILHDELYEKTSTIHNMRQREGPLTECDRKKLCQMMSDTEKKLYYFNINMAGKRQVPNRRKSIDYDQKMRQEVNGLREKNGRLLKENMNLTTLLQDTLKGTKSRSEEYPPRVTSADRMNKLDQASYQQQPLEASMEVKMQRINRTMEELLKLKDIVNKKNETLEAQVHQLQNQEDLMNEKNANLEKKIQHQTDEIKQLKNYTDELKAKIEQEHKVPNEDKEQNQAIDALAKQLHLKNIMSQETEEKFQTQLNRLTTQNMKLEREAIKLKEETKQMRNHIEMLKAQKESVEYMLKERDRKLKSHEHQFQADSYAVLPRKEVVDNSSNPCYLNRTTKVIEVYEEIYKNEWTDAFQQLLNSGYLEEKAVEALRLVLQDVVQFCEHDIRPFIGKTAGALQLIFEQYWKSETLKAMFTGGEEESAESFGMVSGRRKRVQDTNSKLEDKKNELGVLLAQYAQKVFQEATFGIEYIPALKPYIVKCLNLGWMMTVQFPPVVLRECHDDVDMMFDNSLYTKYKTSGPLVKFVVWPALLQHKDGPIIAKGTAEGKGHVQSRDRRRVNNLYKEHYLQR